MSTYLITGANRGLGLSLVKVLISQPTDRVSRVFAASRSSHAGDALGELIQRANGRIQHVELDISSATSIKSAAATVENKIGDAGLDYLFNNAAVRDDWTPRLEEMTYLRQALDINIASTHDVTVAFLPLLRKGRSKKIVFLSSTLGCITTSQSDPKLVAVAYPAYKISKAGSHMLSTLWSNRLKDEGFCIYMQSPGNLKTELAGGERADLPPETGAQQVIEIAQKAEPADTGRHRNIWVEGWEQGGGIGGRYDGKDHPW